MARITYRFIDGKWRESGERAGPEGKLHLIQDSMAPIENPCEPGVFYDSKSALRRSYRAHGVEETGGSRWAGKKAEMPPVKETILEVFRERKYGSGRRY